MSRLIAQAAPRARRKLVTPAWPCMCRVASNTEHATNVSLRREFSNSRQQHVNLDKDPAVVEGSEHSSYSQNAADVSQEVQPEERNHFDRIEEESKTKQMRSPWMREGSDKPPVARLRSAGAMTKGKLLTTPSRMLKLILPLTTRDANKDRKDVEPLALLVHPQQPLSYLERLIQSELPLMKDGEKEKPPTVIFRAEDSSEEDIGSGVSAVEESENDSDMPKEEYELSDAEETRIDGKVEKTGKINPKKDANLPAHGHNENKPPVGAAASHDPEHPNFVRWSPSTEIGDFIRDAARGKEFAVDIEGAPPIYVGVPSFADRTYYLRMRLRKSAKGISQMAGIKKECDDLAQVSAKRVAQGGFAGLIGWWGVVYYLTFKTDLGWDVMEPVTYLVGLSGLIGGYMWFLYHNREVSYRSAMNFTVSRRQSTLYEQKGFKLEKWEALVEEGNRLRREIKMVADEYDVEWNESEDEADDQVREALRDERKKKNGKKNKEDKEAEEDD